MNRSTIVSGFALIALLAGTASAAAGGSEPRGVRVDTVAVPHLTSADISRADRALGADAGRPVNSGRPVSLSIPQGATLYREAVWQDSTKKLGLLRDYRYAKPVDVATRDWRTAVFLEGSGQPNFVVDRYGVSKLKGVEVLIDTNGDVVSVAPYEFASRTGAIKLVPPPRGMRESGEQEEG